MANPKSRIEGELDGVAYTDKSRIEEYIAYIKGDSQTKPDKPRSRIEEQLDGISPGGGGGSTLIERTITENDVYFATDDDADGYSKVTVNVPQPVVTTNIAAADLTNYTSGQTGLGGGFAVINGDGITGVSTKTVGGVEYTGLDMSGSATFQTKLPLSDNYTTLEFDVILTDASIPGDMRITSTGGSYFGMTVWVTTSGQYLRYCTDRGIIMDADHLNPLDPYNYEDTSLPVASLIDTLLKIRYTYDGVYVTLYINDVAKIAWTLAAANSYITTYGLNVGANGAVTPAMLAVKAEYSGEALSWEGHTYIRND